MAAGAWPGAAWAPRAVCACRSPSRGRALLPPVCSLLNSWGPERRRGRGSDPPSPRAQEVLSAQGQPGPGDMRPWGASGVVSRERDGFPWKYSPAYAWTVPSAPLIQLGLSLCSVSGPEPGLTSTPTTTITKRPRLLLALARAPPLGSSQHFEDPLSSLQTLWIPGSHPPLSLLRAFAYPVPSC